MAIKLFQSKAIYQSQPFFTMQYLQSTIFLITLLLSFNFLRLIGKIHEEVRNKNPVVRAKVAQYFLVIVSTYPDQVLEKQQQIIEDFFNHSLSDAKPEVRQIARLAFIKYKEIFPNRGKNLFYYLDISVQKAICDEEDCKFNFWNFSFFFFQL